MGTLSAGPSIKLRVALKVAKAGDGTLSAKLDSIDQGAKDLPVSMIRQTGQSVALELKMVGASYDGTLNADGSEMSGTWKQGGGAAPLTFRRVDKVEVAGPRPQDPKKPYPYTEEEVAVRKQGGRIEAGRYADTASGEGSLRGGAADYRVGPAGPRRIDHGTSSVPGAGRPLDAQGDRRAARGRSRRRRIHRRRKECHHRGFRRRRAGRRGVLEGARRAPPHRIDRTQRRRHDRSDGRGALEGCLVHRADGWRRREWRRALARAGRRHSQGHGRK